MPPGLCVVTARRRVLQPHAPLLDDLCRPQPQAAHFARLQRQGHRVHWLGRWVQQQARHIERPLFVFEDGLSAFEDEFPVSQTPAQRILVLDTLSVVNSGSAVRGWILDIGYWMFDVRCPLSSVFRFQRFSFQHFSFSHFRPLSCGPIASCQLSRSHILLSVFGR
jgi:hypothetical protein